ncbi:TetR/AcrR family transcriptional regulator [Gordonia iterans]|uniref:TetR/AcrR family transcriptional regulator n=1 Tax=Gordonia iterans TaxID=1004901 RepID=UPI001F4701B8|nr:TetR family transcriptional regulator [Gordonia iterans]
MTIDSGREQDTKAGVRERLLHSAIVLLRSRGADGFGMTELLDSSAVARRSMYQHFPRGKAQLLEAAAAEAGARIGAELDAVLAAHPPVEALALWVEQWKHALTASDYRFGCPLAAATQAAQEYPAAAAAAARAFAGFTDRIAAAFVRSGFGDDAARSAARVMVSGVEGAIITAQSLRTVAPLDDLVAHARRHLTSPLA